jgi:hypothetical protein
MLVLSGVLLVAKPFSQSGVLFWGILVSDLAGGILVLAALARNARFSLPRTLRGALWTGTVLSAVHGVIGVVIYLWMVTASFVSAEREGRAPTSLGNVGVDYLEESYRRLHALTFLEMGKAGWILVGLGVAHAVVGLLGLGSLWFGAPRVSGGEGEGGLRIPPPLPDGVPGRGAAPGEEGLL